MATVVDFPGTGEIISPQGTIPVLTDQEALINAINLWLCSFRGERLYRPRSGGVLASNLLKPMSNAGADQIHSAVTFGLKNEFTPSVNVQNCTVVPDYQKNTYWIEIKGYCPALKVSILNKLGLKPLV